MLTDAELVELVQGGDRSAFAELVGRYERAVWARAWHVIGDYHASQDAVQDAFLEAFRRLGQLRRPASFGLWLMRIVEHEAIRTARLQRRTNEIDEAVADSASDGRDPDLTDEAARLVAKVGRLPDHERTVVALRYFQGHSVAEIARLTARPVGTVTKQLSRALERLKSVLREVNT
ncbi:MAG TPA: sigma-70 family RNA polymerase sigma factor [Pirellulales bacterium]|nr:sigma-70 family RNA polymerase sigma factor [Pirellulales bacterium]